MQKTTVLTATTLLFLLGLPTLAKAQAAPSEPAYAAVPAGASIEPLGDGTVWLSSAAELDALVAPVALYPDPLLAIVLPAAAYPLQIVEASRFLKALENDPALEPSPEWDDSVVALLNYPEVLAELDADINWTLRLGEAVIQQQSDVLAAVQRFRSRVHAAGNLESDGRQSVRATDSAIEIAPADQAAIYVPMYEPAQVVVASSRPEIRYYPDPRPVYYYPYASSHAFRDDWFWGVTSAFALGWPDHRLHVVHHSFPGHPYFGRDYARRWWYRRPTLTWHNDRYFRYRAPVPAHVRNRYGDSWSWRHTRRVPVRPPVYSGPRGLSTGNDRARRYASRLEPVTPPRAVNRSRPVSPARDARVDRRDLVVTPGAASRRVYTTTTPPSRASRPAPRPAVRPAQRYSTTAPSRSRGVPSRGTSRTRSISSGAPAERTNRD